MCNGHFYGFISFFNMHYYKNHPCVVLFVLYFTFYITNFIKDQKNEKNIKMLISLFPNK